jgi:ABC-2 type transport system ATP-binding protein
VDIHINNLKKIFGEKVAVDIDQYTILQGTILGLVGNNGAGKTTLFRLMLDLIKADDGEVCFDEINVSSTEDWKKSTGSFIDEGFLIDYLTPEEYFDFVGKVNGLTKDEMSSRLENFQKLMNGEIVGQKKLIRNLSAGNKQKVGIIAAMLHRPNLLILDEPFNFLDPSSQNHVKQILIDYNRETGATVIVSSHNLTHTVDISTRVALMENGKLIKDINNADGSAENELNEYFNLE